MSCLTEQERIALEDIFLSISVNQSPVVKLKMLCRDYSNGLGLRKKAKAIRIHTASIIGSRRNLKTYVSAKLYFREKREALRHHFVIKHFSRRS